MFVSIDVTFRESEPFYGESTDLSLLFTELDQLHSVEDGHEREKVVSHPQQADSVGINTDNGIQDQLIVSTIQNGSLQIPIEPVRDRWPQNL
jgi:hypothetical protein